VAATAALAASAATWFVTGHISPTTAAPPMATPVATVTMTRQEIRTIQLVFNSEAAMNDAQLSLQLPSGVELARHRNRRDFLWNTRLQTGKNILPLDLVVREGAGGELVARLSHAGKMKTFRINVAVSTRSEYT
jgi:hypothetical protein